MRKTPFLAATATAALLCGIAAAQRAGSGDGDSGVPKAAQLPAPEQLPPATGPVPAFPGTLTAGPVATLISKSAQCGSPRGLEVRIVPPSGIPPTALNQALANLVFVEPSWSLSDVKRAIRMMGATDDPSAIPLLQEIISQAPSIVRRRSAALARTVSEQDRPAFQAWLQGETADLRRVALEQLPATRRPQ